MMSWQVDDEVVGVATVVLSARARTFLPMSFVTRKYGDSEYNVLSTRARWFCTRIGSLRMGVSCSSVGAGRRTADAAERFHRSRRRRRSKLRKWKRRQSYRVVGVVNVAVHSRAARRLWPQRRRAPLNAPRSASASRKGAGAGEILRTAARTSVADSARLENGSVNRALVGPKKRPCHGSPCVSRRPYYATKS